MHLAPPHLGRALAASRRRGVSLLALLLSLCLVAVVAVVAIPLYFEQHEVTLDAACKLLARDLRAVQNRAAFHKLGARLVLHSDGWSAVDTSGAPIEGLGEDQPIVRHFSTDGVFEGVAIREINLGPDSAIGIDTRGLVTQRGELVFVFGPDSRRVEIERGSGQVLIFEPGQSIPSEARILR
ncbi:MAG: hypothetical protein IT454_09845 [Planctomycetes bacterium]|nr:hypothetical protein [Planctomycetota bacterium]